VVFTTAGTYTVRLTVTDALGLADGTPATRTVTVNSNPAPNGVINTPTANVTITAGQSVNFTGTGSDPNNNTPLTFAWNFGGGAANSSVEDPGAVVFSTAGTYTVTFTVADAFGASDPTPDTRTVTVNAAANQAPNGVIDTPTANVTIIAGQSVSFTGTGSDPNNNLPLTFAWNFGGGATNSTVEDPGAVVFSTAGTFTVSFTVTDALGLADPTPATRTVTVTANQAPNGVIDTPTANVTIAAGQSVNFTGTGSDPNNNLPLTFAWNFGGGATNSTVEDPGAVVFSSAGTFTVTFTVTDALGLADPTPATRTVTVTGAANQAPNGVIDTPTANVTIAAGQSVSFTGTGSDPNNNLPLTFAWNFGGGATNSTVEDPGAVVFSTAGTFTVTFTVTDALGLADPSPATRTVTVTATANQAPNGVIDTPTANVTIAAGQSVSFTGTGSDPNNNLPLTFAWNFGGGATNSTVEDPGAVVFNTAGTFTVTFTVTDALGLADPTPATRTVTVTGTGEPGAERRDRHADGERHDHGRPERQLHRHGERSEQQPAAHVRVELRRRRHELDGRGPGCRGVQHRGHLHRDVHGHGRARPRGSLACHPHGHRELVRRRLHQPGHELVVRNGSLGLEGRRQCHAHPGRRRLGGRVRLPRDRTRVHLELRHRGQPAERRQPRGRHDVQLRCLGPLRRGDGERPDPDHGVRERRQGGAARLAAGDVELELAASAVQLHRAGDRLQPLLHR
jgi:PKD repeat protein